MSKFIRYQNIESIRQYYHELMLIDYLRTMLCISIFYVNIDPLEYNLSLYIKRLRYRLIRWCVGTSIICYHFKGFYKYNIFHMEHILIYNCGEYLPRIPITLTRLLIHLATTL